LPSLTQLTSGKILCSTMYVLPVLCSGLRDDMDTNYRLDPRSNMTNFSSLMWGLNLPNRLVVALVVEKSF
jgi:hypothetical protein